MNQEIRVFSNASIYFLKSAVAALLLAIVLFICYVPPIPQDLSYHNFADHRRLAGIDNFWNVVTNLGFLIVGLRGLFSLLVSSSFRVIPEIKSAYILLFAGVSLIAFGSAFYHVHPTNFTLVWDRLPMTIVFMALLVICIAEYASAKWAGACLLSLLLTGLGSVFYWYLTELNERGDLRPYFLVQFLPVIVLPVLLLLRKSRFTGQWGYWIMFCCYVAAKVAEHDDYKIYQLSGHLIAGHALKHIFIVLGLLMLIKAYSTRKLSIVL